MGGLQALFVPGFKIMGRMSVPGKMYWLLLWVVIIQVCDTLWGWQWSLPAWGLLLYFGFITYKVQVAGLAGLVGFLDQVAAGNLQVRLGAAGNDESNRLAQAMQRMVTNLSFMVASVRSNSALVAHAGSSLLQSSRQLSERTEQQAANLEQTSASVHDLTHSVQANAQTTQASTLQAGQVREQADHGAQAMARAVQSVELIQGSAQRMNEIIGVIDGLAFQTNILALNAAVEAARAGEAGRGFAVVASEVRSLAQRSAESAREIRQLIQTSSEQIMSSVTQIRDAGRDMSGMVQGIHGMAGSMGGIAQSMQEQSSTLGEINTALQQLDALTQQNAQMVEHAVSQAQHLQQRADTLSQAVATFKLQQGTADEALALVRRAVGMRRQCGSRAAFLQKLTDPASGFHDRDMYVFALNASGRYEAFGGNPAKVGTRVQDISGTNGQALLDAIVQQAQQAPGWVEYDITNPASGKVQTKMSFVCQVDDLYLGCGIYKNLVS